MITNDDQTLINHANALLHAKNPSTQSTLFTWQYKMLINKRQKMLKKMCFHTLRNLGPQADRAINDYLESHWPTGTRGLFEDAINFLEYLNSAKIYENSIDQGEKIWLNFLERNSKFKIIIYKNPLAHQKNERISILSHWQIVIFWRSNLGEPRQWRLKFGWSK